MDGSDIFTLGSAVLNVAQATKNSSLEKQLKAMSDEAMRLRQALANADQLNAVLIKNDTILRATVDDQKSKLAIAAQNHAALSNANKGLQDARVQDCAEIAELGSQLAGANERWNLAETRAADAETRCTTAEARATDAETRCTTAEARATDAETRCATAEARATGAETRYTTAEARVTDAETRRGAAEARATDAETRRGAAEARATEAERELATLRDRTRDLEARLAEHDQ